MKALWGIVALSLVTFGCIGVEGLTNGSRAREDGGGGVQDRDAASSVDAPTGDTSDVTPGHCPCQSNDVCIDDLCWPQPIAIGGAGGAVHGVNVTSTEIVWSEAFRFLKKPLSGGAPAVLPPNDGTTSPFTNDGTTLFWGRNEEVFSMPLAGATPVLLTTMPGSPVEAVAVAGPDLYFTFGDGSKLFAMPKTGAPPRECLAGLDAPGPVFVSAGRVYVGERSRISTTPEGCAPGASVSALLATKGVQGIFVEPPFLWYSSWTDRAVYRVRLDVSPVAAQRIATTGQTEPGQVWVTSDAVYFAAGPSVMKMRR